MNAMLPPYMTEATRLTREGRLTEATTLLRQGLLGPTGTPAPTTPAAPAAPGRQPRIIDVEPSPDEDPTPRPARQAGGAFLAGTFQGEAGRRDFRLYVPGTAGQGPLPLLVMLHGCTQSPDDFAAGTRMNTLAEAQGWLVAYPGQTQSANPQKCWNWFSPADQQRDRGEPALIAGITRQVMREHAVDASRVYVAGLSAGGAAAAIMGMAYPDLYAAVGVHSGLACGAARDMPSAFTAMRQGAPAPRATGGGVPPLPAIVFHGDSDRTVHPRNGDQVIEQFTPGGALQREVQAGQVPGGRRYQRTVFRDATGLAMQEHWLVAGGGHAWSGGSAQGSHTDPLGPDASREMLRFFAAHRLHGG